MEGRVHTESSPRDTFRSRLTPMYRTAKLPFAAIIAVTAGVGNGTYMHIHVPEPN